MKIENLTLNSNGHVLPRHQDLSIIRPTRGGKPVVVGVSYCAMCGAYPKFEVTSDTVQALDPCPFPDGITTEITLNVPSGKLIVTDDLRPVYDWYDRTFADYNTVRGQAQAVEAMAAIGCAYGPVGNSSPGLYRTGPDTYVIANPGYDDNDSPSLPEDTRLAGICTDLWAYSIADFEHWKARGGNPDKLNNCDTVVDVHPGTYRFIHHYGERGFDAYAAETVIFAHIERIA